MLSDGAPIVGDWPAWAPPEVRWLQGPATGAAEIAWRRTAAAALHEEAASDVIVGLGLATAGELGTLAPTSAALLPSPTDTELPPSVRRRLHAMAEAARAPVASPELASQRPGYAALLALGAIQPVSVVVPNFNYGRYIEDRLRQIDRQTYPIGEIVVLDDASTDNSVQRIRAVLPTLATPARLIVNDRNSGSAFAQWAKGVRAVTGELVWIAEADDRASPDFLARLAPALDDPKTVMAQSQSRQIGAEGEVRHDDYGFYLAEVGADRWAQSYRAKGGEQAVSTLAVMNTIPNVSAALFRRSALSAALEASASRLETFRLAGDWLVYLELLSRGDFAFAAEALNDHRVHEASVTASALTPLDRVLEVARMQKIARERLGPPPDTVSAATAYLQKLYVYFGLAEGAAPHVYDHPAFAALKPTG